jgi:hypothetical protein
VYVQARIPTGSRPLNPKPGKFSKPESLGFANPKWSGFRAWARPGSRARPTLVKSVHSRYTHKLLNYVMYYPDARPPRRTDICSSNTMYAFHRTFEPGIIAICFNVRAVRTEPYYVHSRNVGKSQHFFFNLLQNLSLRVYNTFGQ